jgi:hypothetical protein
MYHFSSKQTIRNIIFGALLFFILPYSSVWADTFIIPGTSTEVTYDPRGNFDVPILSGGNVTTTHVSQDFSLILCNGYQDVYYLNMVRDRTSYAVYKGYVKYRGFSLSGCSTTGEATMMRIMATSSMPEHFSLVSTSVRWNNTLYILNDTFRWLNSTTMAGYENWYPFDMSCTVAFYIVKGGF